MNISVKIKMLLMSILSETTNDSFDSNDVLELVSCCSQFSYSVPMIVIRTVSHSIRSERQLNTQECA